MNQISMQASDMQPAIFSIPAAATRPKVEFRSTMICDATVLHCCGRITYRDEASMLSAKVVELMRPGRQLVLDLREVDRFDSAGLGELMSILSWSRRLGCSLKLAGPNRLVLRLLELTKLTTVLSIYPTVEEALASI